MSSPADQKIITTLAMIADTSNTTLQVLQRMDLAQQAGNMLTDAILETLKKNGSGGGGGGGVFGKVKNFKAGMAEAGISTLKDLKEAAEILPKLAIAMVKFNTLAGRKTKRNVISFITDFRKAIAGEGENKTDFEKFGKGFSAVAGSLTKMAVSMFLFSVIAGPKTQQKTLDFIENFVNKFGAIDMEKVDKGADSLKKITTSLAMLALGLVATTLVMAVAAPLAGLVLIPIIAGIAFLFGVLGKSSEQIDAGAETIAKMSVSMAMFALTIWAVGKLGAADLPTVLQLSMAMGIIGLTMWGIGKLGMAAAEGALIMALVALPILLISAALWVFKQTNFTLKDAGILAVTLGGIALATALAGLVSPFMVAGSLGLAVAGLALIVLSVGLGAFRLLNFKEKDVDIIKYVIGGVAEGFMSMGLGGGVAMFAGGVALVFASAALLALTVGLGAYRLLNFKQKDVDSLKFVIGGMAEGFKSMGLEGGVAMGLGAVALTAASASLLALCLGLGAYRLLNFKKKDVDSIKDVISGISEGFKSMGWKGGIAMTAGGAALVAASLGLTAISAALFIFKKIEFGKKQQDNLDLVLAGVCDAFIAIKDKGWDDIKKGIDAVGGAGSALVDIAAGVKAFANLNFIDPKTGKKVPLTMGELNKVGENIALVLTAVSAAFAEIGMKDDAGLFTSGFVGKGVKAVKGMGSELGDIAKGVQAFASLSFKDKDGKTISLTKETFGMVKENIVNMVGALTDVFASIGGGESAGENEGGLLSRIGSFAKNMLVGGPVQRGLKAVHGLGAEILPIAQAVQTFVNTKFDAKMAAGIGKGISDMINNLMMIQVDPKKSAALNNMGRFLTRLSNLQKPLEGVANSIKGIVGSLERLYSSISKVNEKSLENASLVLQAVAAVSTANTAALSNRVDLSKNVLNYAIDSTKTQTPPKAAPEVKTVDKAPKSKPDAQGERSSKNIQSAAAEQTTMMLQQSVEELSASMSRMAGQMAQMLTALQGTLKVKDVGLLGK